ncbi:VOC family protein [Acuticoccus sp. M5D2P5]|uniref:VOC family protein n=1 Tax=Acuticoccus kalidii TaxID=2910977 RepID=UPI001F1A750C|nr:VOC family protein [Acuticoccus kalidii]MCF3933110.1 VOC family protein [Acuticoccus kalidii]
MTETDYDITSGRNVHSVTPHLIVNDGMAAIAFYKAAFGAEEMIVLPRPDGGLLHGCLSINGSSVMVADEACSSVHAPTSLKGTTVSIHLVVANADEAAAKAVSAGAKLIMPVEDMFWGDRFGVVEDPFGHQWSISTPGKPMSESEMQNAAAAAFAQ